MTTPSTTLARRARNGNGNGNGNGKVTLAAPARELTPAIDVYENGDELLLLADMPGATAESIAVTVEGLQLTVAAERPEHHGEARVRYQRAFRIPNTVDPDGISAELKDGVLHVRLQKVQAAKPRTIPIQA